VALGGEEVEELLADFGAFHKLAAFAARNAKPWILNESANFQCLPKAKTRRVAGLFSGVCQESAMARAINPAVVVVIVLAVVLLAIDTVALHILGLMDAGALLTGHDTVGLGPVLHVVDALLATFQTIGFALGQAAGSDTLIDATLLIGLTLIDTRRIGLGEGQGRQDDGNGGECFDGLHDFPPQIQGELPEPH
jgi:hypothetical protein